MSDRYDKNILDDEFSNDFFDPEHDAQEWNDNLTESIDFNIPFDCVGRDIQQWIIDTAIKPQPALAFSAALAVLSVVMGRNIQVGGIKGNFMSLCLAESGEGKDWPLKACYKILDSIGLAHRVYGDMASGAALIDALCENPSALLPIDEAGHYFASINSKGSNQFSREIMPIITKLYTSSSDTYTDKKRKNEEARKIIEPNLSVIGMTTERQIMDTLRTSEVADGSLARFFIVFGLNDVSINRNRKEFNAIPETITSRLQLLCNDKMPFLSSTNIALTDEYKNAKIDIEDRFNEMAIEIGKKTDDRAIFKPFYYRLSVRAVQMALLLDQCQDVNILNWCADLVLKSCEVFIKKFCHLAADNDNESQVKVIERAIKEAGKRGITKKDFYNKTRKVNIALKTAILKDMHESGKIEIVKEVLTGSNAKQRPSTVYYWLK